MYKGQVLAGVRQAKSLRRGSAPVEGKAGGADGKKAGTGVNEGGKLPTLLQDDGNGGKEEEEEEDEVCPLYTFPSPRDS